MKKMTKQGGIIRPYSEVRETEDLLVVEDLLDKGQFEHGKQVLKRKNM